MAETASSPPPPKPAEPQPLLPSATLDKYKAAGDIVLKALKALAPKITEGANVLELCKEGDKLLEEGAASVYNNKKGVPKGLAFPTCISANNVVCHFSPLPSDEGASQKLQAGDLVKVQLGAHIDGYPTIHAETILIPPSSPDAKSTAAQDVLKAAWHASEIALRLFQVGTKNWAVTDAVRKVTEEFEFKPVEGMLAHQHLQNEIEGKKQIIFNPTEAQRRDFDTITFDEGEVYGVDILISTSEDGKPRREEARTTIYRKGGSAYQLKMKTSRDVYNEIQKKAGAFPFTLRSLEDEKRARLGVMECAKHGLLKPFDVLYDKSPTALVAQFFFTVVVTKTGPIRVSHPPVWYSADKVGESTKDIKDEELKELLGRPLRVAAKKKKQAKEGEAV